MLTKYISKAVYWIFFASLVIVAIFFVHDVCQNYQERATSIQVTTKITKLFEDYENIHFFFLLSFSGKIHLMVPRRIER